MHSPNPTLPRRSSNRAGRWRAVLPACLLVTATALAQTPSAVLEEQQAAQRDAAAHQQRIESLDDRARAQLLAYREELRAVDRLERRNQDLRRQVEAQRNALARLRGERDTLQQLRLDLLPRLRRMIDALDSLVENDLPFLVAERRMRVAELRRALEATDLDMPDLLRRVLQAYLIEAAYGYDLAVERATLHRGETRAAVDFLRLGRIALFYLGLDGRRAGFQPAGAADWVDLPASAIPALAEAIRIVRREAPPALVELPLVEPTGVETAAGERR